MRTRAWMLLAAAVPVAAQQTVAPTTEQVGAPRGVNAGGYNIVNSFETGYRFRTVGGDYGKYRSDVNFGNGIRLLGSRLSIHSREGHGGLFDELLLNTQGLGNDPYQFSSLRIQKNRLYRYDMLWRLNEYFNPGLAIAGGQHLTDTRRRLQDHDLTLFPQSAVRFLFGYSRNSQTGPALSTIQVFDSRGDEFPFFADIRRLRNEYRLGGEVHAAGFRFYWLRGWDNFKEDTPYELLSPQAGNNPADRTTLSAFRRTEPYHGTSPYWRLNLFAEKKLWSAAARYTWVSGRRDFVFDEAAQGTERLGAARNRQTLVFGRGRRPVSAGSLTLSAFPWSKVTIANHTSFHNTRMEGDSALREFVNGLGSGETLFFRMLGIRTISNTTDATVRAAKWLGLYGGYQYSTRRIRSVEQTGFAGVSDRLPAEQDNTVHAGLAGLRLQPVKPLRITLDAELGRADRPFFPISERNYHALGARAQYKRGTVLLSAAARTNYNTNSVSLSTHSSRSRNWSFDAAWSPRGWLAFDAGYSKLHLDTASGIAYFASSRLVRGEQSLYFSNIHAANAGVRFGLRSRADLYVGFSRIQDAGDGRATPAGLAGGSALDVFRGAQTFPLRFQTPLARFSMRLHNKVRWNLGYQYYDYGEEFFSRQDYRAHTGFTSLLWSF